MERLAIGLETFSPTNLASSGVYRYAEDPDFRILLFGYSIDGAPAEVIDLICGEPIPADILQALTDPGIIKSAFNAAFERICLSVYLRRHDPGLLAEGFLDPRGWRCTMVWAASLGLPMSLDGAAKALRLLLEKDPAGQRLIRRFSIPSKDGTRVLPEDDPIGWQQYISYNRRDVDVEVQLAARLAGNPMPDWEWETYWLDQRINDAGVRIDTTLAANAVEVDTHHREACLARARELTGLENPNSPIQLKDWLTAHGCELESLTKAEGETALEPANGDVAEGLRARGGGNFLGSVIRTWLENPRYVGNEMLQATYTDGPGGKLVVNDGALPKYRVQGANPPIIDEATWRRVQDELARRRQSGGRALTPSGGTCGLTHRVVCSQCGRRFHRRTKTRKHISYKYWWCETATRGQGNPCRVPQIREAQLKSAITTHLGLGEWDDQ